VLANGWTYSGWVVGNSRIRAVDSNWPAPGTRILHSIGTWPAVINDETVVHSCAPGEELVLLAKVRPAATARITLRLNDLPGGQCRVAMTEVAASRPVRWVPDSDLFDSAGDAIGARDLMTETRHTVVAGSRRRLDQPAMNSWKADSRFGGSAVTLHWRSVSPIGDRIPRRS
jgi:hypothetical protein